MKRQTGRHSRPGERCVAEYATDGEKIRSTYGITGTV